MRTSIRVYIASLVIVGIFWAFLLKGVHIVLPIAVLILALLSVMWMGWKCLQGNDHSFFWFIGICVVCFLTPAILWQSGGSVHPIRRMIVSGGMLLFAFWPRDLSDEDQEDGDDAYDEDDMYEEDLYMQSSAPSQTVDDLKKIEGIGPAIEQLLYNAGITTYAQIAATSYEGLQTILRSGGEKFQMHDPFTRPDQAALARDGLRTQLATFQDLLDGGTYG